MDEAGPERVAAGPTRFGVFLGIACVALIVIDGALVLRIRHLERRVAQLTAIIDRAGRDTLGEGDRFPDITLIDAQGRPVRLTGVLEQKPTLLLLSSQGCDSCLLAKPLWARAARMLDQDRFRVLGLVLDATPETLGDEDAPYPLLTPGDDAWSLIERIPGIPGAILIEPDGTIARAFYGADQVGLEDAVGAFAARY